MVEKFNSLLYDNDIINIVEMAAEKRRYFNAGLLPIGNDILRLLENEGIILIQYPVENKDGTLNFSAMYLSITEAGQSMCFIGINSADYFDKQIFAAAHELYHHFYKGSPHLCRLSELETTVEEAKANLFAAEFLLPAEILKKEIRNEYGKQDLKSLQHSTILRFISRIHCSWWLPYKSIVKRLYEIDSISHLQYNLLYKENERDETSKYFKAGLNSDTEIFVILNKKTHKAGVDGKNLEVLIRNYEDGIISSSEFASVLEVFGKKPEELGLVEEISKEDLEDMSDFLGERG
jgi:Zn-dependent peptidase ImmA (M78 family)